MKSQFNMADPLIDILNVESPEKIDEHRMLMVSPPPEQGNQRFRIRSREFAIPDASQGKQDCLRIFFRRFRNPARQFATEEFCNLEPSCHMNL